MRDRDDIFAPFIGEPTVGLPIATVSQAGQTPMNSAEKPPISARIQTALDRLDAAIKLHKPIAVFGLFSGGHDSLSATYVASLHPSFTSAVHINTGIGIEATRDFVRATAVRRGWPLAEYKASENTKADGTPDPMVYDDMVRAYGFPGPAGHGMMYNKLKERQLRRLERDYGASCRGKDKRRVLFVSGVRSQESTRRMGHVEEIQIDGRRIWCAPIHDWTKLDTTDLISHAGIQRNPVVDLIHKSGECLCGAFSAPGELEELNIWEETRPCYAHIKALESEVKAKFGWGWEGRPAKKPKPMKSIGPLCQGCLHLYPEFSASDNFTPEQSRGRAIPHSAREILNGQFETSAAGSASEGCDLESSG